MAFQSKRGCFKCGNRQWKLIISYRQMFLMSIQLVILLRIARRSKGFATIAGSQAMNRRLARLHDRSLQNNAIRAVELVTFKPNVRA